MKKLLILLLIVPVLGFGQTLKDLMSISSINMFKKVAIENDFIFIEEESDADATVYAIGYDGDDEAQRWLVYNKIDDSFSLTYAYPYSKYEYNLIVNNIKNTCKYYDVVTREYSDGVIEDYVCYSCSNSELRGKICFALFEGRGVIRLYPDT